MKALLIVAIAFGVIILCMSETFADAIIKVLGG